MSILSLRIPKIFLLRVSMQKKSCYNEAYGQIKTSVNELYGTK